MRNFNVTAVAVEADKIIINKNEGRGGLKFREATPTKP